MSESGSCYDVYLRRLLEIYSKKNVSIQKKQIQDWLDDVKTSTEKSDIDHDQKKNTAQRYHDLYKNFCNELNVQPRLIYNQHSKFNDWGHMTYGGGVKIKFKITLLLKTNVFFSGFSFGGQDLDQLDRKDKFMHLQLLVRLCPNVKFLTIKDDSIIPQFGHGLRVDKFKNLQKISINVESGFSIARARTFDLPILLHCF